MPREPGRNDRRSRIAHLAARIMVEDGIEDYAHAKRKAARQAGAADTRELPTNEEIDVELQTYRQLYHQDEHRDRLRELRLRALSVMQRLVEFDPHLTGSVLNGNAGRYAEIHIQLFTDNEKAVEHFLIDKDIPYRATQRRLYVGAESLTAPVFELDDRGTTIELTVLSRRELRGQLRTSPEGKPIERARPQAVEVLLAQEESGA